MERQVSIGFSTPGLSGGGSPKGRALSGFKHILDVICKHIYSCVSPFNLEAAKIHGAKSFILFMGKEKRENG